MIKNKVDLKKSENDDKPQIASDKNIKLKSKLIESRSFNNSVTKSTGLMIASGANKKVD